MLIMLMPLLTLIKCQPIIHGVPVHIIKPPESSNQASVHDVLDGLEFLKVYNYLIIDPGKETDLPSNDEIQSALVTMQRFGGLEQTGEFDEPTLAMMRRPRCGVADIIVRTQDGNETTRVKRYRTAGSRYRWSTNHLTYKMDNYPSQSLTDLDTTLSHDQVDTIIKEAFKVWSDVSSVTFTRIPPNSLDTADIHLLFGARQHSNVYQDPVFDGEGGTLAHAFSPNSGWGETNGDVHFDDDETFTHRVYRGTNLLYTAAHEIGHALGLDHSDVRSALMWPYDRGYQPNFELPADDVAGIQAIYGPKPTAEPPLPAYCNTTFNAVAVIYQKLYIFTSTLLWQFTLDGDILTNPDGEDQRNHFKRLPRRTQAVYERWYDGKIIFLKGKKVHIYDGDVAETPKGGAFITNELSDKLPTSITGVLHNRENGQTDFLRGNKVWRYDEIEKQLMKGFPKRTNPSVFPRLPKKPNGAFFDKHSHAVILKGRQYSRYTATNHGTYMLTSDENDARNFAVDYLQCPQNER